MSFLNRVFLWCILCCSISCVTIAPPGPMATYGGPSTTEKGSSETAIAFGTGASLFDGAHAGAQGWFGRFNHGVGNKVDVGIDVMGAKRNSGLSFAIKGLTRYQLTSKARLELGLGVADDSSGKSWNTDAALTVGTLRDKPWNFYSSLRLGYAHGVRGNYINLPGQERGTDTIPPPNTLIGLLNLGAQGKINENQRFIIEGGYGQLFPVGLESGPAFYFSMGVVFKIK